MSLPLSHSTSQPGNPAPIPSAATGAARPDAPRRQSVDAGLWKFDVVGLLSLSVITAGCWCAVIAPSLSRSHLEAEATDRLRDVRRESGELSRRLAAVQSDLLAARREFLTYGQPCWTDGDRSRRLEWIYTIARSNGLNVDAIEPGNIEPVGGRRALPIRVAARGPYAALTRTLRDVRLSMPDVVLRSAEATPINPSATYTTDSRDLAVVLELYWIPTTLDAAPPDAAAPPASGAPAPVTTSAR